MRTSRTFVLSLALLVGSGCAVGPNYVRPEMELPEEYVQPAATGESAANLPWWEVFDDPQLQELIRLALVENKDLQIATWRIEEARALHGFTRADLYPSFRYEASAQRTDPSDATIFPGDIRNDFLLGAGVFWEIDVWGKLRRASEAARADMLATVENQRAVTLSLVADVATLYISLVDLDERLRVSQRTLTSRQESTALIRSRFEGGVVPELDVRQAEIEEATAAVAVPAFERAVAQTENALNVLLGRNPGAVARVDTSGIMPLPTEIPVGLPSELLQRRPDVLVAEHQLHAQTARIGVAQALRFPSLSLTGAGGLQSGDLSDLLESKASFWNVGAGLVGPLFEFGKNKRRVEIEWARTEQLARAYEKTVLVAFQDVEDALVGMRTYRDEFTARERQVQSARAAAMLSRARYDGGVTNYLEVLDAERSLFQAELGVSEAYRNYRAAIIQLYKALGGGWSPEELPEAAPGGE
jgi:multidrug efflux system outer membrane protein